MNALTTKLLIADAFVSLCDEQPLGKVSISDIIERTGKNRKTFYYHFIDKDYLITWIFRYDLGLALKQRFPETTLVYERPSDDSASQFPYYITNKTGVRSLDHSEFYRCFGEVFENRRNFYTQALFENGPTALRNYIYDLYLPALKQDITLILSNRFLPEENIQYLAEFYTCAFLYYYIRKCHIPGIKKLSGDAGPFANIIHSSIEMEIKDAQLRRVL